MAATVIVEIYDENGRVSCVLTTQNMNRRDFLAASSSILLPMTLNGMGLTAFSEHSDAVKSLREVAGNVEDRIVVMINLIGGNDGLNMVIPLDQYTAYYNLRSNIAIPANKVLPLSGVYQTGLHPAMTGMQEMYKEGKLSIIHSVGYPNANQSHFRSADIWMSGVDADKYATTGWMGRYLQNRYSGYPKGYPNATMEDPVALQIGYLATPTLQGTTQTMAVTIDSPENFANLIGTGDKLSSSDIPMNTVGKQIAFLRQQQDLAIGYAKEIKLAANLGVNSTAYPSNNDLANQLKIVAKLIHGGLKTKVYFVTQYGYDTHSKQVDTTDNSKGNHADLLGKLSAAIKAFQSDIELIGFGDKVVGMTFSEFGRRANSNDSKGTDHGVAAPMFVFGNAVKTQIIGKNPDLTNGLLPEKPEAWEKGRDLKMQTDFRQVYSAVLKDWLGTSDDTMNNILLGKSFEPSAIFRDTKALANEEDISTNLKIYPNPAQNETFIESELLLKNNAELFLTDVYGRNFENNQSRISRTTIRLDVSNLSSGKYFIRLNTDAEPVVKTLIVAR